MARAPLMGVKATLCQELQFCPFGNDSDYWWWRSSKKPTLFRFWCVRARQSIIKTALQQVFRIYDTSNQRIGQKVLQRVSRLPSSQQCVVRVESGSRNKKHLLGGVKESLSLYSKLPTYPRRRWNQMLQRMKLSDTREVHCFVDIKA